MRVSRKSPFREAPLQPLLLRNLQLRCGEWSIRSLRVNRHLQPFDRVAPHRHPHGQLLLYLRGRGEQQVDEKIWSVVSGAIFFIPPGKKHAFRETGPRRAICLVVDLLGQGPRRWGFRHGFLPAEAMAEVRLKVAGHGGGASPGVGAFGRKCSSAGFRFMSEGLWQRQGGDCFPVIGRAKVGESLENR